MTHTRADGTADQDSGAGQEEYAWLTTKELATQFRLEESHISVVLRALGLQEMTSEIPSQKAQDLRLGHQEGVEIFKGLRLQMGAVRWHPQRTPQLLQEAGLQVMEDGDTLFVAAAKVKCRMDMMAHYSNTGEETKAAGALKKAIDHMRRGISGDQRPYVPRNERSQLNKKLAARMFRLLIQTFGVKQTFVESMMAIEGVEMEPLRRSLLAQEAAQVRNGLDEVAEGIRHPRM